MKILGVAGYSDSGKTTLLESLIPELSARGLRVSTFKHAHHAFDVDSPGKDSYRHRSAGAVEVLIASTARWVLMHEARDEPEADLEELLPRMTPVDLLLVEGYKRHRHPKIEVHRPALGKPMLQPEEPTVIAVASDGPVGALPVPILDLNDPGAVADFVVAWMGAAGAEPRGADHDPGA